MSQCDRCCGCGNDVTDKKTNRRLLRSSKSQHVFSLWKAFVTHLDHSCNLGEGFEYMCRSCFSAFERYADLQKKIENNLVKYFDEQSTTPKRIKLDPSPVMLSTDSSASSSPAVGV